MGIYARKGLAFSNVAKLHCSASLLSVPSNFHQNKLKRGSRTVTNTDEVTYLQVLLKTFILP